MANQNSGREWHGKYRARVVETDIEGNDYGAIRVFIPDLFDPNLMKQSDPQFNEWKDGLIAYPANNPIGGYNTEDPQGEANFQSSLCVPLKNSWVWVEFEGGDISRPFYGNAFMYRNCKVPPENRNVDKPHKVYTICKTQSGRAIVLSDSTDCERVEITGKKRLMKPGTSGGAGLGAPIGVGVTSSGGAAASNIGPEGDDISVYRINDENNPDNGNMTSILLDEREGKEKILIKTHKGDYIHIDVDERQLQCYFKGHMLIETESNLDLNIKGNLNVKVGGSIHLETGDAYTLLSEGSIVSQSNASISSKSKSDTFIDADGAVQVQLPGAQVAPKVTPAKPLGGRET